MAKLIYCLKCKDIIKLKYHEMKYCECGKSGGMYAAENSGIPDKETGIVGYAKIVGDDAVVLGIANEDLSRIPAVLHNPYFVDIVRCWIVTPRAYDYRECGFENANDSSFDLSAVQFA